ncbi:PmoA family protein [Chitinophaga horti]|uniref:PmoA family protein n=1 Tax=Chitinophaga horti TaxID=2920382 RepID=A0ABY6IVD1_9BACT|nr:PmoA family protein [Chitinophaga horti]UYQ91326.1 PmoA family protein [Chitinophaga horti]
MKKLTLLFSFFMLNLMNMDAQMLARITVKAGKVARTNTLASISLDRFPATADSLFTLEEVRNGKRLNVPVQVEQEGAARRLWWQVSGDLAAGSSRSYELVKKPSPSTPHISLKDENGALIIEGLLQYNYATVNPPAGVDTVFRRSGFIHPLWSPKGAMLTNMHPKDHYHHYGIWNPWTETEFEGERIDFWNLVKKQGTVQFKGFASKTEGPVWTGFAALQDHVVLTTGKTALNELLDVRAYENSHTWDFASIQSCATSSPLLLKQYRYGGGFNIRGNANWNATNSRIITSEGHTRNNADSSLARWVLIYGDTEKGRAGLLIMAHPSNYNFPVPLRVWPEKDQQGQVCVFFTPTKTTSWLLTGGTAYAQRYRVKVFDGEMSTAAAEALWQDYAAPVEVTVK